MVTQALFGSCCCLLLLGFTHQSGSSVLYVSTLYYCPCVQYAGYAASARPVCSAVCHLSAGICLFWSLLLTCIDSLFDKLCFQRGGFTNAHC